VFMQFERQASGEMVPLPKPSVDTGMGLERIAAVMQGVHSNYEIDMFQHLLKAAAAATNSSDLEHKSLRVIADHIRSCSFLVLDGVMPSNEGRGYVLRRIIRRAVRHGHKLGQTQAFFNGLVGSLVEVMGEAYPALAQHQAQIEKVLLAEEKQFEKTLDKGLTVLDQALAGVSGTVIPGQVIFSLYDTYGFPVDLTNDIARERNMTLDLEGYETAMNEQRARARAAGSFKVDYTAALDIEGETEFKGYDSLSGSATVTALLKDGAAVATLNAGDSGVVVLEQTPFYAESGGQAGDSGTLFTNGVKFNVSDCSKEGANHLHLGELAEGSIAVGDTLEAQVNQGQRQATALNHSATHLLHSALRKVLGDHVTQKGSLVNADRLRFDFSHSEAVGAEELKTIERIVNEQIRHNSAVATDVCDMDTAKEKGAMALFGEKYGDDVRVLSMGEAGFSVELCGGTHVARTGDIGLLRIASESGVAAGVRRIEALTGELALSAFDRADAQVAQVIHLLKANRENVSDKLTQLVSHHRQLEKDIAVLKTQLASASGGDMLGDAIDVAGIKVLAVNLGGVDAKSLRDTADQLKNKLGTAVVLLAAVEGEKISLVASVTKDATSKVKAGDLMRYMAEQVGGKGGGRPDMAQGGGTDLAALPAALTSVAEWVKQQVSG